jgi:hypothetical protein
MGLGGHCARVGWRDCGADCVSIEPTKDHQKAVMDSLFTATNHQRTVN